MSASSLLEKITPSRKPKGDLERNRSVPGELGTTLEELKSADRHLSPRSFGPAYYETPDGDPIVGLCYVSDFRAEEEWGGADLRKALHGEATGAAQFTPAPGSSAHIRCFEDVNAVVISVRPLGEEPLIWGESEIGYGTDYADHFSRAREYLLKERLPYRGRAKMAELRELATEHGLERPWPRRKNDLYEALLDKLINDGVEPESFPGWFQDGEHLILRADGDGLTARILARLRAAGEAGALGIGGQTSGLARGLFLYDTRDVTPGLIAAVEADQRWHDKQMRKLAPVERRLKEKGFRWFALGNPSERTNRETGEQEIRYWLNGMSGTHEGRNYPQPYGWYTLEQLEALEFIGDAIERRAKRRV